MLMHTDISALPYKLYGKIKIEGHLTGKPPLSFQFDCMFVIVVCSVLLRLILL